MSDFLRDQIARLDHTNRQQATALAEAKLAISMATAVDDADERNRALMAALDAIQGALEPPPPPDRQCSVCGIGEDDEDLIDVTVLVADGEEGYAWIKQLLCTSHFPAIQQTLMAAGFVDHRHGGTNHLEDPRCPGTTGSMKNCPTPWREDEDVDPYDRPLLVRPKVNGVSH